MRECVKLVNQEKDILKEILNSNSIIARYQPIISLAKKCIVGFEGLARGVDRYNGEIISPAQMFELAYVNNKVVELDRLCRDKCIEHYKPIYEAHNDIHLFLNIEASILETVQGSNYLLDQVKKHNIEPCNIVIEINETRVESKETLTRFIKHYKSMGFLIAIDDIGTGFSNFERITIAEPDIIKLDRSLVKDIEKSYYKQEIFKSLVNLANKIGAVVVAEGVETKDELNSVIEYGAHLVQGFLFSKPNLFNTTSISDLNKKINDRAEKYSEYMQIKVKEERNKKKLIDQAIRNMVSRLEVKKVTDFDTTLKEFVSEYVDINIECIYVLDRKGIQISDTIFFSTVESNRKRLLFQPTFKGADNSLKKYYLDIMNHRLSKYISEPYISHATGSVCTTISKTFENIQSMKCILCIDFTCY